MGALNMVGRHGQAQRSVMRSGKSVPQASYYAFLAPKNVSMRDENVQTIRLPGNQASYQR